MMHFENPGVLQLCIFTQVIAICSSKCAQVWKNRDGKTVFFFFAEKSTETAAPADTREKS